MSGSGSAGDQRESRLLEAFVQLADTLVDDYDVVDLLHQLVAHCVRILEVDAAALLLVTQRPGEELQVLASSTEQTRLLELFQVQTNEGPCLDCVRTGEPVVVADLTQAAERWPHFASRALREGFSRVHAVPLRLRGQTIGALNLFGKGVGALPDRDLLVARALADTATIGILQERAVHRGEVLTEQLETALHSRVIIEQAKGVLAQAGAVDMDQAFQALRRYARGRRLRLSDTAHRIVAGTLHPDELLTST
ncbi:GAF and ANTAR domain-containing protein [Actinophytocola sp.]|uniref:GAF and ANTAR domain-containing protein n=1 Tax=Actinophytocola sp. TaxID=1872138 RepID=UPI002D7E7A3A|nr:GAF and ANTAR domain-containing protein [Actinophytocola sp.]HET9139176.1 GAF and ANTAR domain-containing protein [Actinophytocola sp.]